jgi:hypothetical protein
MSDGKAGGRVILKARTLQEMHRVQWLQPDWKSGWGIGFAINHTDKGTTVGHGGALAGYRTQISFSPENKIGVIVLTNADDGNPEFYVDRIFSLLGAAVKKAVTPAPVVARADPEWNNLVGTYRDPWGDSEILIVNGELVMIDPTADDPKETLLKLVPEGKNRFRIVAEKFNYGEIGELVTFEMGADGKAARMKVGENYTPRLK